MKTKVRANLNTNFEHLFEIEKFHAFSRDLTFHLNNGVQLSSSDTKQASKPHGREEGKKCSDKRQQR